MYNLLILVTYRLCSLKGNIIINRYTYQTRDCDRAFVIWHQASTRADGQAVVQYSPEIVWCTRGIVIVLAPPSSVIPSKSDPDIFGSKPPPVEFLYNYIFMFIITIQWKKILNIKTGLGNKDEYYVCNFYLFS